MTDFLTRNMRQTATYWGPGVADGFGGKTYAAPIQVKVRWEDTNVLFVDQNGNEVVSKAVVYVDTDLSVGGYLLLGISTASNPTTIIGTHEIRNISKSPNIRGTKFLRKIDL